MERNTSIPPSHTPSSAASTNLLRVGILDPIAELDPRAAADNSSTQVLGQIFEAPFAMQGGASQCRPLLFASPLELEASPKEHPVYSAPVREEVMFSDGTPLTAAIMARSLASSRALGNNASVEARGNRVRFTLNRPNPRFDLTLTHDNCGIVLEKDGVFLGTGPMMFADRTQLRAPSRASSLRLVRNPRHRTESSIDEVKFQVLPADKDGAPSALIEAFRRNEIDMTTALTLHDIEKHQLSSATPSLHPSNCTGILFFNTRRPALSDPAVRRAISRAVNTGEIAKRSFEKHHAACIAISLLPPMMGRAMGAPQYSVTDAKAILKSVSSPPERLTLLLPWSPRPYLPKPLAAAQAIQKDLEVLGIEVTFVETPTSERFFREIAAGNYDLALAGWIADTPDPADFFEALLWSKMAEGKHYSNYSHWKHTAMDEALGRFRENPTDANKSEIQRLIRDEAPLMPLIYGQQAVIHTRKVRDVVVSATGIVSFATVKV